MALRQHRLPRFWLGLTLGLVMAGLGGAHWWERQLPRRLEQAAARGDLEACLRYSEQLQALRWLDERVPQQQADCRRRQAAQLWQQRQWRQALLLQLQLVNSAAGLPADRQRLDSWQDSLQQQALARFQQGDLEGALTLLRPMGEHRRADGSGLGDRLRQLWERNRQGLERARQLAAAERWWEAMEALNRLDHPWWKQQAAPVQQTVEQGIARLRNAEREHDSHGSLPHSVPLEQLDREVRRRIDAGVDEWSAFDQACRALGGRVVEAGPDSACQR